MGRLRGRETVQNPASARSTAEVCRVVRRLRALVGRPSHPRRLLPTFTSRSTPPAPLLQRAVDVRPRAPPPLLRPPGEILGRDLVEEVLELLDHGLGVLDLVLELDRRLGDHLVGRED